jgi:signal transduction histidine kinase
MVSVSEKQHSRQKGGSAALRMALFFFISHALVAFLIFIIFIISFYSSPANAFFYAIIISLPSLLFSLFLVYHLHQLEIVLDRIARGLVVYTNTLRRHWPLTHFFVLVETIVQRDGQQIQIAQRNVEYRDQLLQQVSKTAAQEERNRLARDLHDSIKQQIFSIVVSAAAVRARWERNSASAYKIVDDIERTASEAQVEMQALLQQLRPVALENVGLIESLRMQCQALGYRTGAEVEAELDELPSEDLLPLGTQETIFRVVQEGFANIARHARAPRVWLRLYRQGDALYVEIGDNGQGFDLKHQAEHPNKSGGMGLNNVRERITALGGIVTIWSRPDEGTTLNLCIPLTKSPHQTQAEAQELLDRNTANIVRKSERTFHIGLRVAELAAALMLLYTPIEVSMLAIPACAIAALIIWLWAQQYRLQVNFGVGTEHAMSYRLRALSYELLAEIFLLVVVCPIYSGVFARDLLISGLGGLLYFGISLAGLGSIFALHVRNRSHYQHMLPHAEQEQQLQQFIRRVIVDWIAWVGSAVVVITMLFLHTKFLSSEYSYSFTYRIGVQLAASGILIAWFVANVTKWLRLVRWQRSLTKTTPGEIKL